MLAFFVSDQPDTQDTVHLLRVNANLMRSLRRCHALVEECRGKLAANNNEPFMLAGDKEQRSDAAEPPPPER